MLIYNLDRCDVPPELRLVNGSRGVVNELVSLEVCMRELEEEERKARDATAASPGGGYKSHLRTQSETSTMVAIARSSVLKQYVDALKSKGHDINSLLFPRITFMNGVCKVLSPCYFSQTLYDGGSVFRIQLPIRCHAPFHSHQCLMRRRLAWCLTVHKVQGASIDFLDVDLEGCFEHGQAYVALSRARTASGLSIRNFEDRWIKTHAGAKRFHQV